MGRARVAKAVKLDTEENTRKTGGEGYVYGVYEKSSSAATAQLYYIKWSPALACTSIMCSRFLCYCMCAWPKGNYSPQRDSKHHTAAAAAVCSLALCVTSPIAHWSRAATALDTAMRRCSRRKTYCLQTMENINQPLVLFSHNSLLILYTYNIFFKPS